jgi:hypothetical protein
LSANTIEVISNKDERREPTWPFPARYWWLKRLTLAGVTLAVALSAVRVAWGREARRRLDLALAPVITPGEAVSAPGLTAMPVPADQNGAPVYRRAIDAIGVESPSSSSLRYNDYLPLPPRWHKLEDKSIATNGGMLAAVREARRFSRFDWGLNVPTPAFGFRPAFWHRAHHLSNVLHDAALHAHVHGDDVQALERIRDLLQLARAIDAAPTLPDAHLLSVYNISGGLLYNLQIIAPGLTLAPEDAGASAESGTAPAVPASTQPTTRPATRGQVRALISELLDEREQAAGLRRAAVAERAVQLDMGEWLARSAPLLRPMFQLDLVRVARGRNAVVAATAESTWPAAKAVLSSEPMLRQTAQTNIWTAAAPGGFRALSRKDPVDYTRLLSTDVCNSPLLARVIEYDLRTRAEKRMAATALAIRLYRADHADPFPPALETLVPKYLPQVPRDPFAADAPLAYIIARAALPDGGDRPLVYSRGIDGRDDTAERGNSILPPTPSVGLRRSADYWIDVSRWVPSKTAEELKDDAEAEKEAEAIIRK